MDDTLLENAITRFKGWHDHYNTRHLQNRMGVPNALAPGERAHMITIPAQIEFLENALAGVSSYEDALLLARAVMY